MVESTHMVKDSKNETTNAQAAIQAPLVVELLGPAGVGKTTLARAVRERHEHVAPDIDARLAKVDKLPFVIRNTCSLLPGHLLHYRHGRWFNRRETRSMAYLEAGLRLLERDPPAGNAIVILDHGPIYRLAFLREFGPAVTTGHTYQRWWRDLLRRWAARLDLVISLDAPNPVLQNRIRARSSWHSIKDRSELEADEILNRYRTAFERTIAEALTLDHVQLLRFDTSRRSTEEIAAELLQTLAPTGEPDPIRSDIGAGMPSLSPQFSCEQQSASG